MAIETSLDSEYRIVVNAGRRTLQEEKTASKGMEMEKNRNVRMLRKQELCKSKGRRAVSQKASKGGCVCYGGLDRGVHTMILVEKDKPSMLFDLENTVPSVSYGPKVKKQDGKTGERAGGQDLNIQIFF